MPPKSTWVEPKLLTGFVSQIFDWELEQRQLFFLVGEVE
jgi:hypothetical protein